MNGGAATSPRRPAGEAGARLSLVLGGGAARGLAHIDVLVTGVMTREILEDGSIDTLRRA